MWTGGLTNLVEGKPFGANPRVSGVVVAIVKHFTAQILVGVVTGFFACALKL